MNNFDDIIINAPETGTPTNEGQAPQLSKEDYAAKKKTEREGVFALADSTAMSVAEGGDKFKQFLDVQSTFDRYSAVNTLLIMAQKPEATRLGDFDHWKEKGGYIKQGQTAIAILEPQEYTKEDGTPGIGYNIKKVFDISQVDSRNVKKFPTPTYTDRQLLTALVSKAPVTITSVEQLPDNIGATTNIETGEISVRKGMEFADLFRSISQELAYTAVVYRDANDNTPQDARFTAYCASYAVCKKYGIDTQSFDFEKAAEVFDGMEPQEVKNELSYINKAVESITERMAKQLDAAQKAARNTEAR